MKRLLVAIFLVIAIGLPASSAIGVTATSAATLVNIDIPISGSVFNPCNGEVVAFSGVDHVTVHITLDNSGGFHADVHENIHVTAVGDQGNRYVGNQEVNAPFNGKVGFETTSTLTFSETSLGSAPNFDVHAIFHLTVNPNGTVTAFVDHFTASCRG